MATDLSHVKMIEYVRQIGDYEVDEVALFNINHISADEARRLIAAGEYHRDLLCIPKVQYLSLFKNENIQKIKEEMEK